MKPRTTLALLVLSLAAFALLWQYQLREGAPGAKSDERTRLFPGLEAAQVEWAELAQPDGQVVRLERRGAAWRIAKPLDAAADHIAADGVASALAELASATVFDPNATDPAQRPEKRESYGLTREPRVRFSARGAAHALRLGDPTPVSGNSYVAIEGDPRVFIVSQWQTNALSKPLAELRDARLFDFDRDKLAKIALAFEGGAATLEKKNGVWRLTAPLADAADEVAVQSLISDLAALRAESFLDAPPPDAELGLAPPSYRAELTLEGGATYTLQLGAKRDGEKRVARVGGVVEVAAAAVEHLPQTASALRDKTLASFVGPDAQRFTHTLAEPGGEALVVQGTNSANGWKTAPPMAAGAASALMAEVASLTGRDVAAESLGSAELAAFGLAPPRARIEVHGGGDKAPLLADVRLGVLRPGSGLAAQRADRPAVYWIDESRANALPQSAGQFRASFTEKPAASGAAAAPPKGGAAPTPAPGAAPAPKPAASAAAKPKP